MRVGSHALGRSLSRKTRRPAGASLVEQYMLLTRSIHRPMVSASMSMYTLSALQRNNEDALPLQDLSTTTSTSPTFLQTAIPYHFRNITSPRIKFEFSTL